MRREGRAKLRTAGLTRSSAFIANFMNHVIARTEFCVTAAEYIVGLTHRLPLARLHDTNASVTFIEK
jgi:hypothetical protein